MVSLIFERNLKNNMHTVKTLASLILHIFSTICIGSWRVAFLCAGLASMGHHRKRMRSQFIAALDKSTNDGNVQMRFKVRGKNFVFLMREGNMADYLIGGELVWGAYNPPTQKPTLIVDGGANIGMFSLLAHAYFPEVGILCYEPDKANLRQLERNFAANQISAEIVPKALWSKQTTLYYHAGASYTGYVDESPPGEEIACAIARVEDGCWLKLDVEGAEHEVLPEVLGRGVRPAFISMEIHSNNQKGAKLVRLLEQSGYRLLNAFDPVPDCLNIEADYIG